MYYNAYNFTSNESTGILESLLPSSHYWNLFNIYSSGDSAAVYDKKHAFDFKDSTYWVSPITSTKSTLTFCFKYFYVKATRYYIVSSGLGYRPKKWIFSGSNNMQNWEHEEEHEKSAAANERIDVEWNPSTNYKCFRITCLESTTSSVSNLFDIKQRFGHSVNLHTIFFILSIYNKHE